MNDLSGANLGQYQLLNLIGKGGMATVYRGYQPTMGREVAVKVLSPDLAGEPEFITRFKREAQIIAQLQHPHILPVYDFGQEDRFTYLVMRLMTGGSLNDELKAGRMGIDRVIEMTKQIASALDYAHRRAIVHRDLKPSNVLLDDEANSYLTDFGIAKMIGGTVTGLTSPGSVMGTPTYMSPEQWRAEPVDARTDVYALGVMIYQMLLGQVPFAAETPHGLMYQHLDVEPTPPHNLNPALPLSIEPVIRRALAKNREERYASAGQLAQDLESALRFPSRLPEQTRLDAPPVRPSGLAPTGPTLPPPVTGDLDAELAEEELNGLAADQPVPGRYAPTIRSLTPPAAPPVWEAPRPTSPQLRPAPPPPEPSHYQQRSTPPPYPAYQPLSGGTSTPPLEAYSEPYRPPEPEYTRDYRAPTAGGAGRLLGIVAAVIAAIIVFAGILLVAGVLLSSPGDKKNAAPTTPPTIPPTNVPAGLRPLVTIQAPLGSANVTLGDTVTIQFTATGPQSITRVELRRFNQVIYAVDVGSQATYQGSFVYQPDSTGVHLLEIVAWSSAIQSDPVSVTILVQ
jgi:serine/threonine protein kinase